MKIKTTVAALSILSVLSFGAFAADSINSDQAQGRQSIGTISVGAVSSSPMDMHEMLNKKAQEEGHLLIALSKPVPVTTGTLRQSFINKT
jgi:uncharacterized protein involved in high-affinity Fe2+ transport